MQFLSISKEELHMIFEELLADVIKGKFLENLTGEKIYYLSSTRGNNHSTHITRDQFQELIYTLEAFYMDKEKELDEIYRKLKMLDIDLFRYEKMVFSSDDKTITPLHLAVDRQVDPETDKKVLKKLISEMRKRNQQTFFDSTIQSYKHTKNPSYKGTLNIMPSNSLMRCSIMDIAIANDNWPAVELFLNEGFNADQIIRTIPDLMMHTSTTAVEGMPRLHFAYQFGSNDMFARLVTSPKINVNFRCRYISEQITQTPIYEGYGESILLDALAYSDNVLHMDKVAILLKSPNIDLTLQTIAVNDARSIPNKTALDIVLRVAPPQNKDLVALVKTAIGEKIVERFNAVQQALKPLVLTNLSKLVALYDISTENLATTESGQQYLSEFTSMTFKFEDARQQGTWEVQNQPQDDHKEEQKERIEPKEEKYPKPK